MIKQILKTPDNSLRQRSEEVVSFDKAKITSAIFNAARSVGGTDINQAKMITENVMNVLEQKYHNKVPTVEDIQDIIEKILIETGHAKTAKAFILYRAEREKERKKAVGSDAETDAMFGYKSKLYYRRKRNVPLAVPRHDDSSLWLYCFQFCPQFLSGLQRRSWQRGIP